MAKTTKFIDFFEDWIEVHKKPVLRYVTLIKWQRYVRYMRENHPKLKLVEMNRMTLQKIATKFGENHSKSTVSSLLYAVTCALRDAYDEGLIERMPPTVSRLTIPDNGNKRTAEKFLNQNEARELVRVMKLEGEINWDYFILMLLKTGMRFAEGLALTPEDFDFDNRTVRINKTYDYKHSLGFTLTKTENSVREIVLDWHFIHVFMPIISSLPPNTLIFKPIFSKDTEGKIYNSTGNMRLARLCKNANIPRITLHSLRHTHASTLISDGVSIASVAKRLGHAGTEITQRVYVHLQAELEARDTTAMMKSLSGIC